MTLHKTQSIIALSKARFKVLCCGRRWGKTTLAIEEIKGKVAAGKKDIAYIATTYQQARDIAWEMLKKEFQGASFNESRLEIKVNDCRIVLRGWESIETLRGQHFDFLVLDEVASMRNFWTGWQEVLRPTLTDTKGNVIFISTPKGYNHFYTLSMKANDDSDYETFHYSSYDNPYLHKEEIDKAKIELPENKFAQEYLADFRKVEGLVYNLEDSEYIEDLSKDIKTEKRIIGVDWGYRNPAAIIVLYLRDKVWTIVEEWKMAERTTAEIIKKMQNLIKEHRVTQVYPDSAEPDRIEECRRAGIPVYDTCKDIEGGISFIQTLIKEKRFKVCNSCKHTKEELNTYQYPEGVDGKPDKEIPEKLNDHIMDAMRYAIFSSGDNAALFGKASTLPNQEPIKSIKSKSIRDILSNEPEKPTFGTASPL